MALGNVTTVSTDKATQTASQGPGSASVISRALRSAQLASHAASARNLMSQQDGGTCPAGAAEPQQAPNAPKVLQHLLCHLKVCGHQAEAAIQVNECNQWAV